LEAPFCFGFVLLTHVRVDEGVGALLRVQRRLLVVDDVMPEAAADWSNAE